MTRVYSPARSSCAACSSKSSGSSLAPNGFASMPTRRGPEHPHTGDASPKPYRPLSENPSMGPEVPCSEESKALCAKVKDTNNVYAKPMILAVINPEHKNQAEALLRQGGTSYRNIEITTPAQLQRCINKRGMGQTKRFPEYSRDNFQTLCIIVSETVSTVTYNVSSVIRRLCIDRSLSSIMSDGIGYNGTIIKDTATWCGEPLFSWTIRQADNFRHHILTIAGHCFFHVPESFSANKLFRQPDTGPTPISPETAHAITNVALQMKEEGIPKSEEEPASSSEKTGESQSWFEGCAGFFSILLGVAAGVVGVGAAAAVYSATWCSKAGLFIQGPLGFAVAANFSNSAAIGAAVGSAALTGGAFLAASGAIYFVPWKRVFAYLRRTLAQIWDVICSLMDWFWNKIKEAGAALKSTVLKVSRAVMEKIAAFWKSWAFF